MKHPPSYISNIKAWIILVFALLFLIFFDLLSGLYLERLFYSSSYNFSKELTKTKSDTIILGSSTAARGIDPVAFDNVLGTKTYSFAKDGTGIFYAISVLRNIPKNNNLRYVIFGIDPASFVSGFSSKNFKQIERLLPYASQDSHLYAYLERKINWLNIKMLSSSYPYIASAKEIFKNALRGNDTVQNGFKPLKGIMDPKSKIRAVDIAHPPVQRIADESLAALKVLAADIEERKAILILVTVPLFGRTNRSRSPENTLVMDKINTTLASDYLCDLSMLSSKEIEFISINNELFYDSAHLNITGSSWFTTNFAKNVEKICMN